MKSILAGLTVLAFAAAAPAYAQQHADTASGMQSGEARTPSPTTASPPSDALPVPGQPPRHSYSQQVVINHYTTVQSDDGGAHHMMMHHHMRHHMMRHHMKHHRMMRHHRMMHHRMMHDSMSGSEPAPAAAPGVPPPAPGTSAGGLGTQGHNFPGTDNTKH